MGFTSIGKQYHAIFKVGLSNGVTISSVYITVVAPLEHTGREYHTDEGVIVPCISVQLRNKLIKVSGR